MGFKGKHANACKGAGGGGGGAGAPAKKKGLSIGSIILIVALVCSVIYLAAGVGWQHRKGERGLVGHPWARQRGRPVFLHLYPCSLLQRQLPQHSLINLQPPTTNHEPPKTTTPPPYTS